MPETLNDEVALPRSQEQTTDIELSMLSEAMMDVLMQYSDLPPKIQKDILEDVYTRHKEGWPFAKIASRVKILAQKGTELVNMGPEHSDQNYTPKPSFEELKLNGETEKLIKELEKIKKEKEKKEKNLNEETPKEPPIEEWIQ